jgi:hypothetical protein
MKKGLGSAYDKWNISVVIGGDRTIFEVMTLTLPKGTIDSL